MSVKYLAYRTGPVFERLGLSDFQLTSWWCLDVATDRGFQPSVRLTMKGQYSENVGFGRAEMNSNVKRIESRPKHVQDG